MDKILKHEREGADDSNRRLELSNNARLKFCCGKYSRAELNKILEEIHMSPFGFYAKKENKKL